MDPQDYDPLGSLPYLSLLEQVLREFRQLSTHAELVGQLGGDSLTDVTELPQFRLMDDLQPLPSGFAQRAYQFRDPNHGRGIMDAAFHGTELVNVRAQLFFTGWLAKSRARKYFQRVLLPWYQERFGEAGGEPDYCLFSCGGLVGVARYLSRAASVSAHLTDERYA